jgi:carbohydrate-binding DOMON domain-containing protein
LPFSNYLANVTKGGSLFKENAVASFQDTESAAVQRTYGVSSLYDVVTGELVTFTANTVSVTWTNPPVSSTPTPTPTPIATPTATPSPTASPSPTPSTTTTPSPTPEPTSEGLSAEALIGIAIVIAIIIVVIVAYLIIKKPKLVK